MTRKDKEKLNTLERRLSFLNSRVYQSGNDLSYDKAESSALEWAIEIIEVYLKVKERECDHFWDTFTPFWKKPELIYVLCKKCLKINKLKIVKFNKDLEEA